jgi:hypothetical protein
MRTALRSRIETDAFIEKRRRDIMLRRAFTLIIVLGLALSALSGPASAAPTVTFKLQAVPIPGFPHTGDILGAGTDVRFEFAIAGDEYFGSAPPLIGAQFYAPKGIVPHTAGFPTCAERTILTIGPSACPKGSSAGPTGTVLGYVTFGGERVEETGELRSFFKPGGGLEYFGEGHTPVSLEVLVTGNYSHLGGIDGYGFEEEEEVPLIATVPDGPYASIKTIASTFGSAIRSHGRAIYYFRLPKTCPRGGFPLKADAIFAEDGDPTKPEQVTAFYKAPCPHAAGREARRRPLEIDRGLINRGLPRAHRHCRLPARSFVQAQPATWCSAKNA